MKLHPLFGHLVRKGDSHGKGGWEAPRKGGRLHKGLDIAAHAGEGFYAPTKCVVVREARPYRNDNILSGVVLKVLQEEEEGLSLKFFYVKTQRHLIGQTVEAGERIGTVQDLTVRYPGITNHVHVEVWSGRTRVDPTPFFERLS